MESGIQKEDLSKFFDIEAYGVKVRIAADSDVLLHAMLERVRKAYGERFRIIELNEEPAHFFGLCEQNGRFSYFENERPPGSMEVLEHILMYFESHLRMEIAEYTVEKVFIHAGVVEWKGKAVVIPGFSHSGKTTLVSELIKVGAAYYSDEYAVIDLNGLCHPFPRDLAVRGIKSENEQTDVRAADLGAAIGRVPVMVGAVVLTSFEPDAVWRPEMLSIGQGMLEVLPHAISVSRNTEFAMKALKNMLDGAIIARSSRNDASITARAILNLIDNNCNTANIA